MFEHAGKIGLCLVVALFVEACDGEDNGESDDSPPFEDSGGGADLVTFDGDGPIDTTQEEVTVDSSQQDQTLDPEIVGGVVIYEVRAPSVEQLNGGGIAAAFFAPEPANEDPPLATVGECVINPTNPDSELFPSPPTLDAGTITARLGEETVTLDIETADDGPHYVSDVEEDRIEFFSAGLTIEVTATGGQDVGLFSGQVGAPLEPVISNPQWSSGFDGSHSADQPLQVSWQSTALQNHEATISIVPIAVFPEPGILEGNAIACTVPDTGSYTVPVEALEYLPLSGGLGPNTALTVIVSNANVFSLGVVEVTLNATATQTVIGAIN